MEKISIPIRQETLERLKMLKGVDTQSYDDVITTLIDYKEDEVFSLEEIEGIMRGLDDIKHGRVRSLEQVARDLGIQLSS